MELTACCILGRRSPLDPNSKIIKRLTGLEKEWRIRRYVQLVMTTCLPHLTFPHICLNSEYYKTRLILNL